MLKRVLVAALVLVALTVPALPMHPTLLFGQGGTTAAPATISFNTSSINNTSGTTHTFSGVSTGTAAGRTVIATVTCGLTSARTINGLTIDGNSMTKIVANSSVAIPAALFALNYTTGTSSTFVVTLNGSEANCTLGSFSAYGLGSITADGTALVNSNTTAALSLSVSTVSGGVAVGAYMNFCGSAAPGGTITADFNVQDGNFNNNVGGHQTTSGGSASLTNASCSFNMAGVLASFH